MREQSAIEDYQPAEPTSGGIWTELGLPSRGATLFDLIHLGLSFEYLDRVANLLQVKREVIAKAICISPTTLSRREKAGRFNAAESDRLLALIAVYEEALSLFDGEVSAARKWMNSRVRGLGSRRPIEMLGTGVETNAVFNLIGRLERGVLV